jgi:hypothetical protein
MNDYIWPMINSALLISIVLERKISTRQSREELIRRGVLIPDQGESYGGKINVINSVHLFKALPQPPVSVCGIVMPKTTLTRAAVLY